MIAVARMDDRGRIVVPKHLREKIGLKKGGYVKIWVKNNTIIIEPLESIADKYLGKFKIKNWPRDLDKFIEEVVKDWWMKRNT